LGGGSQRAGSGLLRSTGERGGSGARHFAAEQLAIVRVARCETKPHASVCAPSSSEFGITGDISAALAPYIEAGATFLYQTINRFGAAGVRIKALKLEFTNHIIEQGLMGSLGESGGGFFEEINACFVEALNLCFKLPDKVPVRCIGINSVTLVGGDHVGAWGVVPGGKHGGKDGFVYRAWLTFSGVVNTKAKAAMVEKVRDLIGTSPGITEDDLGTALAMVLTRVDLKLLLVELLKLKHIVAQAPPPPTSKTLFGPTSVYSLQPVTNFGMVLASVGMVCFPVAQHVIGRDWEDEVARKNQKKGLFF